MKNFVNTTILAALLFLGAMMPAAAAAQTPSCEGTVFNCFILQAPSVDVPAILGSHGLTEVSDVRAGEPALKLVTGPAGLSPTTTLALVSIDPRVISIEIVQNMAITESFAGVELDASDPGVVNAVSSSGTYSGPEAPFFSTGLWNGYASQPFLDLIKVPQAHADPRPEAMGTGVVAIIDTGVDPDHPLLQGALVAGYDFLLDQPGYASEWEALDPATRAQDETDLRAVADQSYGTILDGDATVLVDQSYGTILDQSYGTILDDKDLPDGFGHGTMVAGIVRLMAPAALIMPLRVFDGDGTSDMGRIIRAIYYAVDNGANVINMSFSTDTYSPELLQALDYAALNGVIAVASSGNEGQTWDWTCYLPWVNCTLRYPGAFPNVIGVASTDASDATSAFSNRGFTVVTVGGPGEAIVTAFPGGLHAAVSGTSFSSAVIAGASSLLHDFNGSQLVGASYLDANLALEESSVDTGDEKLGWGRVDVLQLMNCGLSGGTC